MNKIESLYYRIIILCANSILFNAVYSANPSTTAVSVTIPAVVQISGLNDISMVATDFTNAITGATTACIYTNLINPLGSYYITASSNYAASGVFRLSNGSSFLSYSAFWNPAAASTSTQPLSSGVKSSQQANGNGSSLTCSGSPNANFNINIAIANLAGAPPGTYTDTVTLVISPA